MISGASFQLIAKSFPLFLKGLLTTIEITLYSITIGMVLGVILGTINSNKLKSPPISAVINCFVSLIRGTPVFVQLLIIYFAIPNLIGVNISPFAASVITLGINSTAYVSEIARAGINSIHQGQWEASYALGYGKIATMSHVILPQMLRNILPTLTNELSSLIKETSILSIIGVVELTKVGKDIAARHLDPMTIYTTVAILYLIMTSSVTYFMKKIERKIHYD